MSIQTFFALHFRKIRIIFFLLLSLVLLYVIVLITQNIFIQSPNTNVEEEVRKTVEVVGKLMELPAEMPTVATVSDVTKLPPDQPFFSLAKNGDKVLFYNDAKKAILYRPSIDKIINVAPITVNPVLK